MRKTLGSMRKAITDYSMIEENETVCVAVSGGKDSMLMLKAMSIYRLFSKVPFKLHAICLDMGFNNMDFTTLEKYCKEIDVDLTIKETEISTIVFDVRNEKSPCSLCAKFRRGALHDLALSLGSTKICLGHHADDFLETFYLSLFFEGRINSFKAKTFLDRKGVTVVRPMIYCREQDIIYAVNKNNIPIIKSKCPVDGNTKREEMKDLVKFLSHKYPKSDERAINAVKNLIDSLE